MCEQKFLQRYEGRNGEKDENLNILKYVHIFVRQIVIELMKEQSMTTGTVTLLREAQRLEKAAEILKTIAHPVRLEVLNILETYTELSVSEIQEKLSVSIEQSMLSHHLIKMKDKGILTSQKNGVSVVYRLAEPNITKIFVCMESCSIF